MSSEQIIPAHFGRLRRWFYAHYPIRDVCPVSRWKHVYHESWGDAVCACGRRVWIEYGR